MRVALDARALTGRYTGDRSYWRNLIRTFVSVAPQHEYLIYTRLPIEPGELPKHGSLTLRVAPARNDRIWTMLALPSAVRTDRPDLLHVQYTAPPTILCKCPIITTVHDISFRLHPEWFTPRDRFLMNVTVPASMRSVALVITDSSSSRSDILRSYALNKNSVISIPLGTTIGMDRQFTDAGVDLCDPAQVSENLRERYGIEGPFILAIGVLQPRKNLTMLAHAYGKLKKQHSIPHRLILVGKQGWITARESLLAAAEDDGGVVSRDSILFPGYVPDDDLALFYRGCSLFVHPSLYEGFGIPPLEAMSCGAPTMVSDAPALPEVVGDAAMIVPASDSQAWADSMFRALTDHTVSDHYRAEGPKRAAQFSWQQTARETLMAYESVVGK